MYNEHRRMSYPRPFGSAFSSFFDLEHFILAGIWAAIFELIRYGPKIWARKTEIVSLVKRRLEIVVIIFIMTGLAAMASSPIIIHGVSYGGNPLIGGTSTVITTDFTYVRDLTPLVPVFLSSIVIMIALTAIGEYRRIQREQASF